MTEAIVLTAVTVAVGLAVAAAWRALGRFGGAVLTHLGKLSRLPNQVDQLRTELTTRLDQYAKETREATAEQRREHQHLEKRVTALENIVTGGKHAAP